jgi:hypothetical protein
MEHLTLTVDGKMKEALSRRVHRGGDDGPQAATLLLFLLMAAGMEWNIGKYIILFIVVHKR